jgi:hypothetical protein
MLIVSVIVPLHAYVMRSATILAEVIFVLCPSKHRVTCFNTKITLILTLYITKFHVSLLHANTGRAVCPTAGAEGRATIPKFTTGSFTKIVNYRATGRHSLCAY